MRIGVFFYGAAVLMAVIGIYVLLNSADMGYDAMYSFFQEQFGGSGDTSTYNTLLSNFISNYRMLGGILLGSGLLGIFIVYRNEEK